MTSDAPPPRGPGAARAACLLCALAAGMWYLSRVNRGDAGEDEHVTALGRIEVTARLLDCPDEFPDLGAYKYTYVLQYEVLAVHRQDPEGRYVLKRGDRIFVGHYRPRLPRSRIADPSRGESPLGGALNRIVRGEVHRMALDYGLAALAPGGVLDYCYPPVVNRFFALWTNPGRE